MTSPRQPDGPALAPPSTVAELRERAQRAAEERAALRESELEAQASPVKAPRERIEIWERLHALRLPRTPGHVLVQVIARQTRLTIGQVHEEQQRRAGVIVPMETAAHDQVAAGEPVKPAHTAAPATSLDSTNGRDDGVKNHHRDPHV